MRRTEILRRVTIILIAVICLGVAGIRAYEICKTEKPTENVVRVWYNNHAYLHFKNLKLIAHDPDCSCNTITNENDGFVVKQRVDSDSIIVQSRQKSEND